MATTPTFSTPTKSTATTGVLGLPSNKQFFLWGISGLTLIALADPYPNLAIAFAWLLIIGVLLINSDAYIGLLNAGLSSSSSSTQGGGNRGFVM